MGRKAKSSGSGSSSSPDNILLRCIKSPFRALYWARDFYESSLTGIARGTARAVPRAGGGRGHGFPGRGGSAAGRDDDDIGELIRAQLSARAKTGNVPRSQSAAVTIGRIDEERSLEDDEYPRSKSVAVVIERRERRILR